MKHFYRLIALAGLLLLTGQAEAQTPVHVNRLSGHTPSRPGKSHTTSKSSAPVTSVTPIFATGQPPKERTCFTVESEKKLRERFPKRMTTEQFEARLQSQRARLSAFDPQTVYKIPTIVHIVNYGEPVGTGTNLSQEQVLSQFTAMNDDYRRMGNGFNNHPRGADILVEFVPAVEDPSGKPLHEPGIDRVQGYSAFYDYFTIEYELKPNTSWDPSRYFNIWVVNFGGDMSNVLGYAQFPALPDLDGLPDDQGAATDGIIIGYQYFGTTPNVAPPFNLGRTVTHEAGHWLGLRHIWGDGDCSVDDYCADTPNANGPNTSCDFRDSCPEEGPDMIENYMDYTTDACMNIFTLDQRYRMRTVLELAERRTSIIGCQLAQTAIAGENISTSSGWFEYTASANEVITLSSIGTTELDTRVSVYPSCHTLPIARSDNELGSAQSQLSLALEAGQSVKIRWEALETTESFPWQFSVSAPATGAACLLAEQAVEGVNNLAAVTADLYWYAYAPATGSKTVAIDGNGHNFSLYRGTCDGLTRISEEATFAYAYDVTANAPLYIAVEAGGGNFSWTLTSTNSRAAEICSEAVAINPGDFVVPYASPSRYWYSYTTAVTGTVSVQLQPDWEGRARVRLFKACNAEPAKEAELPEAGVTRLSVQQGERILIQWESIEGAEPLAWTLSSEQFSNGEVCSLARAAVAGINETAFAGQWFSYVVTKKSNLKISSIGLTNVNTHVIVKRTCDGLISYDNDNSQKDGRFVEQSELILFGVNPGERILIQWSDKWSYEGFNWLLEEVDPVAGDNCPNAKQAFVGVNKIDYKKGHANFGDIFWTKFRVPTAGKKVSVFAELPVDLAIYTTNNCVTYSWLAEGQGKAEVFGLPAGQEILIIWDASAYKRSFNWKLKVEDIAAGDRCSQPIQALAGVNTADHADVWYTYTMTQPGSLRLAAQNADTEIAYFSVFDACGGPILYTNLQPEVIYKPEWLITELPAGTRLLFYWFRDYPHTGVTWTLEEIPTRTGDTCADPLPAVLGRNQSTQASQWFSFTADRDMNLRVSSRPFTKEDTDLYIYSDCAGNLLEHNDDVEFPEEFYTYFQSEATVSLTAGQRILIKWAGTWSYRPFAWEMTDADQPRPGDTCDNPLSAIEGVNEGERPNPTWYSFTMPRTAPLVLSSQGYTDLITGMEVYDACDGTLLASDDFSDNSDQTYIYLNEVLEGQTVYIKLLNSPYYASENYSYAWRLRVGDPEPGLFCQFPAAAQPGANVVPAYTSERYWYTYTMPEDGKKLVIKRNGQSAAVLHSVLVTDGCDLFANVYGVADDSLAIIGLAAGQQVYIAWTELMIGERPSFTWTLQVEDYGAGDVCEQAVTAVPGINKSTTRYSWFRFTMPRAGSLRLSSFNLADGRDTYLEVYDACGGNLLVAADNIDEFFSMESEALLTGLDAGETVWFRWSQPYYYQDAFSWRLTVEDTDNNAPVVSDVLYAVPVGSANGQLVGTVQATDADNDDLVYTIVSGNEDEAFSLHATTGALTVRNTTRLTVPDVSRELIIVVTDGIAAVEASVLLDLVTGVEEAFADAVAVYPNPTASSVTVYLPTGMTTQGMVLLDARGTVVKQLEAGVTKFHVEELPAGIYFLRIRTQQGIMTRKVSVVK